MSKRWSKLKKEIESLFVDGLPLSVHCTDMYRAVDSRKYNSGEGYSLQTLGNYRVVLGKQELWELPKDFITRNPESWPKDGPWSYSAKDINIVVRDYIDTPKNELLIKEFDNDIYGITRLFLAADRRISLSKLKDYFDKNRNDAAQGILEVRCSNDRLTTR